MSYNHREATESAKIFTEVKEERRAFKAEWTLEITQRRRTEWNTASKRLNPNRKLAASEMLKLITSIENTVGFTKDSLVGAVRMHRI